MQHIVNRDEVETTSIPRVLRFIQRRTVHRRHSRAHKNMYAYKGIILRFACWSISIIEQALSHAKNQKHAVQETGKQFEIQCIVGYI